MLKLNVMMGVLGMNHKEVKIKKVLVTDKCLRCGLCCHYIVHDKKTGLQSLKCCKHFKVAAGDRPNRCNIYNNRIGTRLGNNYVCGYRLLSRIDYPGCPYNTDKPFTKLHCDLKERGLINGKKMFP